MRFRRSVSTEIDSKIEAAMKKPLTAENLNYIGDLYLRKGSKELTIECYYNAIAKLHVSQRDKMIAFYKKIIKVSPNDEKAYTGLIDIFSRMGLVAEEVNYQIALAKIYQSRGDYEKANLIYRRVQSIDPDNVVVRKYYEKGKLSARHGDVPEPFVGQSSIPESPEDETATIELIDEAELFPDIGSNLDEAYGDIQEEIAPEARDESISDTAPREEDLQKAVAGPLPAETGPPEKIEETTAPVSSIPSNSLRSNRNVYLAVGLGVLLIAAGLAGLFSFRYLRYTGKGRSVEAGGGVAVPGGIFAYKTKDDSFNLVVQELSDAMVKESGLDRFIGSQAVQAAQFYVLTVSPVNGCIPADVVADPYARVTFIDGKSDISVRPLAGLEKLNKIVYKTNVPQCGDNAAVFMKLYVYHEKGKKYGGITIQGLQKGSVETVKWDQ